MMKKLFAVFFFFFFFFAFVCQANAQSCNDPGGFIKSFGTFNIGDPLTLGPDCQHAQSGGPGGQVGLIASNQIWTGVNQFAGDVCFKSGKPMADITCWGAVGNNATLNDTAVTNAIAALAALGGGTLFTPPGTFCFGTGVTNSSPIRFVGAAARASIWSACGNNITPLKMNGTFSLASDMDFFGKGWNGDTSGCCATAPAFIIGTSCVWCQLINLEIQGGAGVQLLGGDWYMHRVTANHSYGTAIFYTNVGGFLNRVAGDQNFPGTSPSPVNVISWTATTSVSLNEILACGGFIFQVTVAGTTGSSCPTPKNYFLNMTDGSATEELASPATYYSFQVDTAGSEIQIHQYDASCFVCTGGIAMTNTLAGVAPSFVEVHQSVLLGITAGFYAHDGRGFNLLSNHGSCLAPACGVVTMSASFVGDGTISDNEFMSSPNGILMSAGDGVSIIGNRFRGISSWAIDVSPNINGVTASGNLLGSAGGATANGLRIQTGTSTHVSIVGNLCNNVTTTCISQGGSGTVYNPAGGNP